MLFIAQGLQAGLGFPKENIDMKTPKFLSGYTRLEKSWVVYDIGNSAFTLLVTTLIPIWFNSLCEKAGMNSVDYLAAWSFATSFATILMIFTGPVFGALADHRGYKKTLFTIVLVLGTVSCACMGIIGILPLPPSLIWVFYLVIYVIAKVAYQTSLVLYDSMLVDVTEPERMDLVSSNGYAWGYIGSCIPFIASLALYLLGSQGKMPMSIAILFGFLLTAAWWYSVTIPLLKLYRQKYYIETGGSYVRESFARIGRTLRTLATKERKVLLFLLAFFLYIDGVYTIIDEAVAIGTALGLNQIGLLVVLLLTQIVAFVFAILFGKLSQKYSTITLISVSIIGYFAVAIYALFMKTLWQFGIMAFVVGVFQGAIQALSRSYYAKIIPPDNSGEFFGIYDICGKGAAFVGTMLIGVTTKLTGSVNIGVGTLAFLFLGGLILLRLADRAKG